MVSIREHIAHQLAQGKDYREVIHRLESMRARRENHGKRKDKTLPTGTNTTQRSKAKT